MEVNNGNKVLLNSLRNDMDKTLQQVRTRSVEILFNPRIQNLLNLTSDVSGNDYYNVGLLKSELQVNNLDSVTLSDAYIMLKDINMVACTSGLYESKNFFKTNISSDIKDYNTWINEYDENVTEKYSLVFSARNSDSHKILYMRSLSLINSKSLANSITISINEDNLIKQLSYIDEINQGTAIILDKNDKIITSSKSINLPDNFKLNTVRDQYDILNTTLNGEQVVISSIYSKVNDWKYVTIVPKSLFLDKINRIRNVTYGGILVCFILGTVLIRYFLKKNYNPINKLMGILTNQSSYVNYNEEKNEFAIIEKGLNKAIEEKNTVINQLNSQKQLLKNNFIEKLIRGKVQERIPIDEALNIYDINKKSNSFAVMLFYLVDNFNEVYDTDKDSSDIYFILSNVIEELVNIDHKGFMVDMDDIMVCLVNLDENRLSAAKLELQKIVEISQQFIDKHFPFRFTVAIGGIHEGIDNIPLAYQEAVDTMEYKKVLGIRQTLQYSDINNNFNGTIYYPLSMEQKLINYVKCGDYNNAKAVVDEVFDNNFKKSNLSVDLTQCLMLTLVSTMIRAANDISNNGKDYFFEDSSFIQKLLSCKSIEEMRFQLEGFLKTFCDYINKINKNSSVWIINDVIPYIEEYYGDCNLSVSLLAEKFDTHPVYFSKVFKDVIGEGLLEFIHKTRIEKSKYIFKENREYSIEQVAKAVGYTNFRSFSRLFKKYEGITPSKYKENLLN
jgi:AraC-like DNA-binding protein